MPQGDVGLRPGVEGEAGPIRERDSGARRMRDVIPALVGIVALLPLLLLIACLIRITSQGPVLVTERRVGMDRRSPSLPDRRRSGRGRRPEAGDRRRLNRGGRLFRIFTFRTIHLTGPRAGDMTPVGRCLRALRLHELPRLINVVMGDMVMVRRARGSTPGPAAPIRWDEP